MAIRILDKPKTWRSGVGLLLVFACGAVSVCAQTTVTLKGAAYTLRDHPRVLLDGPFGRLTTAISDTSAMGRANNGNPVYVALKQDIDTWKSGPYTRPNYDNFYNFSATFSHTAAAALRWLADGDAGSLAAAKYQLNHIEDMVGGTTACDETQPFCGAGNSRYVTMDNGRAWVVAAMQAYSILRSQMSPEERQIFAQKVLNDNDTAHNGISPVACMKMPIAAIPGTLSASGTTVTMVGGTTAQLAPGGSLLDPVTTGITARVVSISDATHFVIDVSPAWSGISMNYSRPWQPGDCGIVWLFKHGTTTPPIVPGQEARIQADYPPNGGSFYFGSLNLTETGLLGLHAIGLALADDDPRAITLLQQSYNWWYDNTYWIMRGRWTGLTTGGALYTGARWHPFAAQQAMMFTNSIVSGPDFLNGYYLRRLPAYSYQLHLPTYGYGGLTFQDIYGNDWSLSGTGGSYLAMLLYPNQDESRYFNSWVRGGGAGGLTTGGILYNGGSNVWLEFLAWDPAITPLPLTSSPTQYLFRANDSGMCSALFGRGCDPGLVLGHVVSRTGWATSDTVVQVQAAGNVCIEDHSGCGNYGSVHIFKDVYLLAGDRQSANGDALTGDNLIQISASNSWATKGTGIGKATVARWAGDDPFGDRQSRYMYTLADMAGAYPNLGYTPTRVHRHVVHLKTGARDYVVHYDDVALPRGDLIQAPLHFFLNGRPASSVISFAGGNNGGTASNTQATSKLLTSVIPKGGVNTALWQDRGPAGEGWTNITMVCAENPANVGVCDTNATRAEWIVVHAPTADTGASMPPLQQPTVSSGFHAVQIDDPDTPRVAVFGSGGDLRSSLSILTSHSGTAQYFVAGLAAGRYDVYRGSTRILAQVTVRVGDGTLYFEDAGGTHQIQLAAITPPGIRKSPKTRIATPVRKP